MNDQYALEQGIYKNFFSLVIAFTSQCIINEVLYYTLYYVLFIYGKLGVVILAYLLSLNVSKNCILL